MATRFDEDEETVEYDEKDNRRNRWLKKKATKKHNRRNFSEDTEPFDEEEAEGNLAEVIEQLKADEE